MEPPHWRTKHALQFQVNVAVLSPSPLISIGIQSF